MRIAARSSQSIIEQRRELTRRRRAAASTIHSAFPTIARVRIELSFRDATRQEPTGQSHVMYPGAQAHFEFACPFGDCDGSLDLNSVVSTLVADSTLHAEGTIRCPGFRTGTEMARQPCGVHANYRIAAQYEPRTGSSS